MIPPFVHKAAAVVASDVTDIAVQGVRGLLVKTAGDYVLLFADDSAQVTVNLLAGTFYPFNVRRVFSTGSAATSGIVAFY